MEEGKYEQVDY
jgi:hypothetical protein